MTTTTQRIAEIRARLEQATPGPWHHWQDNDTPIDVRVCAAPSADGPCEQCVAIAWHTSIAGETVDGKGEEWTPETIAEWTANALFIAHARDDVPWLLAELERALKVIVAARASNAFLVNGYTAVAREYPSQLNKQVDLREWLDAHEAAVMDALEEYDSGVSSAVEAKP